MDCTWAVSLEQMGKHIADSAWMLYAASIVRHIVVHVMSVIWDVCDICCDS